MKRVIYPKRPKITASTSVNTMSNILRSKFNEVNACEGNFEVDLIMWNDAFYFKDDAESKTYRRQVADWVLQQNPDATADDVKIDFDVNGDYHFIVIVTLPNGKEVIGVAEYVGSRVNIDTITSY